MLDVADALKAVHAHIEQNFDAHLERTRDILRQPSISADGTGIREMAEMLTAWLKELDANASLVETTGFPIVYGELNAGAPRTVMVYGMYDTMPVQGETWICDPFAAEIVELSGRGKCIIARGAENSKGSLASFLNMLDSWRAINGNFPVNLKFVLEGEEELGSPNLPKFIAEHQTQLYADAGIYPELCQDRTGKPVMKLGYKGIAFFHLRVRGGEWGGPTERAVHSSRAVWYASPTIVLVQALASLWSQDQQRILMDGFYDDVAPIPPEDEKLLEALARTFNPKSELADDGVRRFKWDARGVELLKKYLYEPSLNICGIHSGSLSGSHTILPHEAEAHIDFRFVPKQTAEKIQAQLIEYFRRKGFPQIEVYLHDTTSWAKTPVTAPPVQAAIQTCREFGLEPEIWPHQAGGSPMYLFTETLGIPLVPFGLGHGGGAHGPNEYATVEGLKLCEKSLASFLAHYALAEHI
ncbi:MAG TPA: M20/M25/M40 family metallo-hydrolase [Anaerolineae bacterium]|nr:M20/M25/M40 family metallo-hydrolase [Anaerolineae bacterium]